jgi:hypothetical protein
MRVDEGLLYTTLQAAKTPKNPSKVVTTQG